MEIDMTLGADVPDFNYCDTCWDAVEALGPEAGRTLKALDSIQPRFCGWDRERRIMTTDFPVEHPVAAGPGLNLLIGDLSDVTRETCEKCRCAAVLLLCPVTGDYVDNLFNVGAAGIAVRTMEAAEDDDIIEDVLFRRGALEWAAGFLKREERVLVVCWARLDRSAAIVAGIMVFHYDYMLAPAVHTLIQRCGAALNRRFLFLLVKACVERRDKQQLGVVPIEFSQA
jgi:hypothetical protein